MQSLESYLDNIDVTDTLCNGVHDCDMCSAYAWCESREELIHCKRCGVIYPAHDILNGVCIHCVKDSINSATVVGYADDRYDGTNGVWDALIEEYFDCNIKDVSNSLLEALREKIVQDGANETTFGGHKYRDKLVKFICEDNETLEDYSNWLEEKQKRKANS